MYEKIYKSLVFPLIQKYYQRDTLSILSEMEKSQWYSPEQIKQLQWAQINALLQHAYQYVPFYRKRFDKIGLHPNDIKTWDDFKQIPLLSKEEIKDEPEKLLSTKSQRRLRLVRTGGSTGQPMKFYYDQIHLSYTIAAASLSRRWWGINIGDRMVLLWGHSRSFDRTLKGRFNSRMKRLRDAIQNCRWISAYNMSDSDLLKYFRLIKRFRPKVMIGYASALYRFANFLKAQDYDAHHLGLEVIISTAETLYSWQRNLLKSVFGCHVVIEYGMTELGILGYECPHGSIHSMDEHIYLEIINNGDKNLPVGMGEIVCTNLRNFSSPLIRYKTGDLAISSENSCSCGRGLGVIGDLRGRSLDLLITPSGKYVHGEYVTHIFDYLDNVTKFQVIQESVKDLKILIVRTGIIAENQERFLIKEIEKHFGSDMNVKLEYVSDIPASPSGKFKYIRTLLNEAKVAEND